MSDEEPGPDSVSAWCGNLWSCSGIVTGVLSYLGTSHELAWAWKNRFVVSSACCSCRGPRFSSQSYTTSFPGALEPYSKTQQAPGMHTVHIHACKQNTYARKIKINRSFKIIIIYFILQFYLLFVILRMKHGTLACYTNFPPLSYMSSPVQL